VFVRVSVCVYVCACQCVCVCVCLCMPKERLCVRECERESVCEIVGVYIHICTSEYMYAHAQLFIGIVHAYIHTHLCACECEKARDFTTDSADLFLICNMTCLYVTWRIPI